MNGGGPRGAESEKLRWLSTISGMGELRAPAPRSGNRDRGSLDHREGVRLLALEQRLQRGVDPERRTCVSWAVGESGLVDRLGNDGS